MKTLRYVILIAIPLMLMFSNCSSDDNDPDPEINLLTTEEMNSLIFMLEEEKLARDVYDFLNETWNSTVFQNIRQSEQSHMDAIIKVLDYYDISYSIKAAGIFNNQDLQILYNQLVNIGESSLLQANVVGATIEDLDIKDLELNMQNLNNSMILGVYSSLQCGSENHLRSFNTQLNLMSYEYSPQYISESLFKTIIESPNESCNN
ncbi:DUF2202 domain-containing protein [Aegicerativicinus sediminis]|uniref:DUF2202 domain-containing protein n=1 Tax=Aegicerativicinus sediminis TaxID=2893202 RepID=UPI001E4DC068|nr:DUF2202 domain-containing protein [Aegicerativicinus sediminis]